MIISPTGLHIIVWAVEEYMCLKTEASSRMQIICRTHAAPGGEKMEVSVATNATNSNTYCGQTKSDTMVNIHLYKLTHWA